MKMGKLLLTWKSGRVESRFINDFFEFIVYIANVGCLVYMVCINMLLFVLLI